MYYLLLTFCAERELVMNPESTDTKEISTSVTSLMKSSSSLLEGAEVKKENGKTIIKPKKKITLKEFPASQPYKFTVDSSIAKPKSARCDFRSYTYSYITDYSAYTGKTVGFFPTVEIGDISWYDMRSKYGFNRIICSQWQYSNAKNIAGFNDNQIFIRIPNTTNLNEWTSVTSNSDFNSVAGFYCDEPFERNAISSQDVILSNINYVANNIGSRQLLLGSYSFGSLLYPNIYKENYHRVFNASQNTSIMCDNYSNILTSWLSYKNEYANRNYWNFIHQDENYSNYNGLIALASNLEINGIFIFTKNGPNDPNIPCFCNYAFNNYWLHAFATHVIVYEYCNYSSDPCVECALDNGSNWYVDQIIYVNDRFEIFP